MKILISLSEIPKILPNPNTKIREITAEITIIAIITTCLLDSNSK